MKVQKIITESERDRIAKLIGNLNMSRPWMITFKLFRQKRSLSQNSLYHLWKAVIAKELGYTPDELHEVLKLKYVGAKMLDIFDGPIVIPKSTKTLDTNEFSKMMDRINRDFSEQGIILPHPGDRGFEEMYEKYKNVK